MVTDMGIVMDWKYSEMYQHISQGIEGSAANEKHKILT